MHFIIDGYNLLGARREMGGNREAARERVLQELEQDRWRKGPSRTVVCDGWRDGFPVEHHEHRAGVEVIYSPRGQTADQLIERLAAEYANECTVVSSDRALQHAVSTHGAFVVGAGTFQDRLRLALAEPEGQGMTERDADRSGRGGMKKGNPRRLPKSVRRRQRRIKGL